MTQESAATVSVEIPELRQLIVAQLAKRFAPEHAERMAEVVLFGELARRPTHGIIRVLPGAKGPVDEEPGPPPSVERLGPSAARIEGRPGMLVATLAAELASEIATERGMAVVTTIGSSSTSGSLTYYADRLADSGLVSIIATNTLAFATPPGGKERILGTNPLAIGIPTAGTPFVWDVATTATTFGDVVEASNQGRLLPTDVAVDAEGEGTVDPEAVLAGGALLPFGGHKGLGLSMAVELLAGVLAGADFAPTGSEGVWGHVFVAVSLDLFGDPVEQRRRAQEGIERLRATPTREGRPVRIPGERSLAARDTALARGTVEVDATSYQRLVKVVGGDT